MSETAAAPQVESTAPVSVKVSHASIRYRVYQDQFFSARDMVSRRFKGRSSVDVHAVNDVSFQVHVGEALGIVGNNGSGKSSLLRAVAGLQSLDSGLIEVRGRTGLLGVGAALKPGLSGYRNVLLGGLAMGLTRAEIEAEMDNVVEFADIGEAMKRPMNTYSSGQQARLAFSIATLRVPEVLLIDEALAVGDREFRHKSLHRIKQIRRRAGTVLMVSHALNEIVGSCTRAIWLENGSVRMEGDPSDVVAAYEAS